MRNVMCMRGRITQLIDVQQFGTIAAEDGGDYVFHGGALVDVTFRQLHIGAAVIFTPVLGTARRAEAVRVMSR